VTTSPPATNHSRERQALPDVQGAPDHRRIAIDRVGVRGITHPIVLSLTGGRTQSTVAQVSMSVSLAADRKGTHMSRFLEVLGAFAGDLGPDRMREMAAELRVRLAAQEAELELSFPYFVSKSAPVTGLSGLMDFPVRVRVTDSAQGSDFVLRVSASATSLCPCSKEIADFGAHNQRCTISAEVRFTGSLVIEDIIDHLEASASCAVYPVLKRPDEKYVTEEAFRNPKFVEDIVRDLAQRLTADERVTWYRISSENFESIHGHNAFAEIERHVR